MSTQRIAHDAAVACAHSIVDCIRPAFRDEEINDVWREVLARVESAIEAAFIARTRELQRLNPTN